MGAFAILIPLIPGLVQSVLNIVSAIRADEGTPEEVKSKLDSISADLKRIVADVQAVELPSGNP